MHSFFFNFENAPLALNEFISSCNADHGSNIPLKELNSEKKNRGEFIILFTIRGFYTYDGLSNYITFRPI